MSSFLVDTHALLWFLGDDPKLSATAKSTMESENNTLFVSSVCVWEMAIKVSLGKLEVPTDLLDTLRAQQFERFEINHDHAWKVRELPLGDHNDPFDRLLAAQALVDDVPIVSNDRHLDTYGVTRHW